MWEKENKNEKRTQKEMKKKSGLKVNKLFLYIILYLF